MLSNLKSIWAQYKVIIICVPSVIGFHYSWYNIQFNPKIVDQNKRHVKVAMLDLEPELTKAKAEAANAKN